MPAKALPIIWPKGGLFRRLSFHDHPSRNFTLDSLNVWPDDSLEGRERGGSRQGMGKALTTQLGSGNPIRSLVDVSYISSGVLITRLMAVANGILYLESSLNTTFTAVTTGLTLNSAVPLQMADRSQILYIADYDTTAPLFDATDGVVASATTFTSASAGSFSGVNANDYSLTMSASGTGNNEVQTITISGTPTGGTFKLSFDYDGAAYQTDPIPFDASAANVGTMLTATLVDENGAAIGTFAGGGGALPGAAVTVTFSGLLANVDIPLLEIDTANLAGGTLTRGTVVKTTRGGPPVGGSYSITANASGTLTLSPALDITSAIGVTFYVTRAPKKYDPVAGTLTQWQATTGYGTVPAGCPLLCLWRDRMVLAGGVKGPHLWYMCRQGDTLDWDYSVINDDGAAVAGQLSLAGQIGEPITCLIPHSDDCLIFGCISSLWIMRGDPGAGGRIDRLSERIGILGAKSWCYTPEGYLYFMSNDGLYEMAPGCGSVPRSVSREVLPNELLDLPGTTVVTMGYDLESRMIYLSLSPATGASTTIHYSLDPKGTANNDSGASVAFWPISVNSNYDAFTMHQRRNYRGTSSTLRPLTKPIWRSDGVASGYSGLMIGCRDGYVRRFQDDLSQDNGTVGANDGTNFSSYIWLGPFAVDDISDAMVHELFFTSGTSSGPVIWEVKVGRSAEECYNATPRAAGTFARTGRNPTVRPRLRGVFMVKLANKWFNSSWALESLTATIERLGRRRL